jgi:uncharacterized membrane protein
MNEYIGKTREEVVEKLGEPDEVSATTKKRKYPSVYKYGKIEYHFHMGVCFMVMSEDHKILAR